MRMRSAVGAALVVLAALFLLTTPLALAADGRVTVAESMIPLGDFELTDQNGKAIQFSSLRGKPVLVFFGFTSCPSICPAAMNELRILTESLDKSGDSVPQVVMISVDGERDTPAVMRAYLEPLSKDFIGLTGDPRLVRDIAARFSAVFFKGIAGDNSGNYQVQHTSMIYLVDAGGTLRATFSDASVEAMLQATRSIVAEAN
jgi:protein SCO1